MTRDPGSPLVVSGFISRHLDLSSRISQTQLKIVNQKIIFRKSDPAHSRPISYSPLSEPPWYCNSISGSRGARNNRKILHFSRVTLPRSHICILSSQTRQICIEARLSVAAGPGGPGLTLASARHILIFTMCHFRSGHCTDQGY